MSRGAVPDHFSLTIRLTRSGVLPGRLSPVGGLLITTGRPSRPEAKMSPPSGWIVPGRISGSFRFSEGQVVP
ncbi:hypothetical protein P0082_02750 [Candidatus Haliotispira prima]|uniref:Uncharacterized protein n=1 Tax=Candidatus Haliotispira prima TaxID=3034016 RepID=A0ABY8MIE9_9SPIO|nr:hypothetical protein P0082_02750 [Candidatus Haliotispira prima]